MVVRKFEDRHQRATLRPLGNVTITPTGNYLFFADNATTSGADVLLHSLTVTPNAVPEPASLALLCAALLGAGLLRRRGSRAGLA
jgi:hypothetical protein